MALRVFSKKAVFLILLCAVLSFSMSGCFDPYVARAARTTAYDFPGSEWQSEEPFIYLRVNENRDDIDGYMLLDSQKIEISCAIDWGRTFVVHKNPEHDRVRVDDYVLEGYCECKEEKIVLTVKKDYCFDNQYNVIILNRIISEEGSNSDTIG